MREGRREKGRAREREKGRAEKIIGREREDRKDR
jgi:hypothetical protein